VRLNLVIRHNDNVEHVPSVTSIGKLFKISFQFREAKTEKQKNTYT